MIVAVCTMLAITILLAAAATDFAARVVSNRLCVALGLDGLAIQLPAHTLAVATLTTLAVFLPAMVCWRHGLMGGGDVKLLGAATLLVHPGAVPAMVLSISLAGGLLALAYWGLARVLPTPAKRRPAGLLRRILRIEHYRIRNGSALPYAIAIAVGTGRVLGLRVLS
jgi:prepilin peptidase CpaA